MTNKKEPQFVDQWLLGQDLSPYTTLWRYNQLNAAERALLAMRRPDSRELVRRQFRELIESQDVDHAQQLLGIETALRGRWNQQKLPGMVMFSRQGAPFVSHEAQ